MNKKILFLSSIPLIAPALLVSSCSSNVNDYQGKSEISRQAFLLFKFDVYRIAENIKPTDPNVFQQAIMLEMQNYPLIKKSKISVKKENNIFLVNYELTIVSGTFDQADQTNELETIEGSLKVQISW